MLLQNYSAEENGFKKVLNSTFLLTKSILSDKKRIKYKQTPGIEPGSPA